MNHPTSEAWMAYLYDETTGEARAEAESHLAACPECRHQVREWQATMGMLNRDELVVTRPVQKNSDAESSATRIRRGWLFLPWAVAAGVALTATFLIGRTTGLNANTANFQRELTNLRADLTRELTDKLGAAHQRDLTQLAAATVQASAAGQRELVTSLAASFDVALNTARVEDRRDFLTALAQYDRRRTGDLESIRDRFEVLAEKTGGAFRETDSRLSALASVLPLPATSASDPTP